MSTRNLDRFFEPRSVALYGASPREGSVGRTVARNILTGGFSGEVWFVNPKGHDIDGHRCLADTAALPGTPDLAVIATPPATVPGIIEAIGERGTRAAVVLTAGLGSGPDSPRAAMLAAAARHGVRVVGANCLGIMAPPVGLNASFAQCNALEGDLAFISQSGAIITSVLDWATSRGSDSPMSSPWATWTTSTSTICSTTWPAMPAAGRSCSTSKAFAMRVPSCRQRAGPPGSSRLW